VLRFVTVLGEIMSFEENDLSNNSVLAQCTSCKGKTNHKALYSISERGDNDEIPLYWIKTYEVIQCLGCNSISFKTEYDDSDNRVVGHNGEEIHLDPIIELFPKRISVSGTGNLREIYLLPNDIKAIYHETLQALNSSLPILAGVGLRAILESVCKDKNAKGNNLYQQIGDLVQQDVLVQSSANILHQIRDLGNDAAHAGKPHKIETLCTAMEIVENLLQNVYIFREKANKLSSKAKKPTLPASPT
jgi:hypothetical protein